MTKIREYDPALDYPSLRECFFELHAHESQSEPLMATEDIADTYLADMIKRAAESSGHVFVAEEDGVFAGFACLMGKVEPEPDESTEPWGYVTDFLVRAAFRGRGIGRQLLAAAEASARAMEIKRLKADVLATNASAREFYRAGGFREYAILLVKSL